MKTTLIIGVGGFIGTIARYVAQQGMNRILPSIFPYGTLAVNLVGCFLIGAFYAFLERNNALSPEWRFFLTTGFCGGFTTFSAFSLESYNLIQQQQYALLSTYIGLSVIVGISATFLGIFLFR